MDKTRGHGKSDKPELSSALPRKSLEEFPKIWGISKLRLVRLFVRSHWRYLSIFPYLDETALVDFVDYLRNPWCLDNTVV